MCQRYALPDQATVEREFMPSRAWWSFTPKYNVAANQYVPAIRWHGGESEAVMMRWGLIPSAAEGRAAESPLTVGVSEIMESQIFRGPWLEGQRCILPMSGFYVWQLTNRRYRQPHFVHLLDRSVFCKDYQTWLRGTPVASKATLHSYNKARMHAYPDSPRVNSTAPDDPGLIQPAELA